MESSGPSAPITVRAAAPEDLEALLDLLGQLHPAFPTDPARARDVLATMLSQDRRLVLVAEADGRVCATADLVIVPNLTHDASPWAIVENFVVDEPSRGRGVGRALIDEIVTRAERSGCYMIQLVSLKHRAAAHDFYARSGFQPVAEGLRRYLPGYAPTGSEDTPHTSA